MAKKMARFWRSQWGSKAWSEEMKAWADAQSELMPIRQFLLDYAGQVVKGSLPFLRKRAKEFVASVHTARVENARHQVKRSEAKEVVPELVEKQEPGPVYVTVEELTGVARALEVQLNEIQARVRSQGEQVQAVSGVVTKLSQLANDVLTPLIKRVETLGATVEALRKQVEDLALKSQPNWMPTKDEFDNFLRNTLSAIDEIRGNMATVESLGAYATQSDLETSIVKAKVGWQTAVEDALGNEVKGKERVAFQKVWKKIMDIWNWQPGAEESSGGGR